MKKVVKITETYTYELELDISDDENIEDVIHETENIRFMSDEQFSEITSKDSYSATLDYEYKD